MIPGWQMEAYERLRAEIVKAAVFDYKKALRKSDRLGVVCGEQIKLEKWFLSKWGQMLSGDNGELIIEKCRKTYKPRAYTKKKGELPESIQRSVYDDYQRGVKYKELHKKYGISRGQLETIFRSWCK